MIRPARPTLAEVPLADLSFQVPLDRLSRRLGGRFSVPASQTAEQEGDGEQAGRRGAQERARRA